MPYYCAHVDELDEVIPELERDGHEVVQIDAVEGRPDYVHVVTKRPLSVELTTRDQGYGWPRVTQGGRS